MTTAGATARHTEPGSGNRLVARNFLRSSFLGYVAIHVACLAVFLVGWSPVAVVTAVLLYLLRMFAITGFYHRYFSHRTFRTSRAAQLLFAVLGASAGQRGPIWWAAHHRHHHKHSDDERDIHSPVRHGLLWSHVGWIWSDEGKAPSLERVKDLTRFPELRLLDRYHVLVPASLALAVWTLGALLGRFAPELGTNGTQMLVWGFCISTTALYHGTYTINSLAHRFGSRRYETTDESRNNFWLALLTLGEGWHNNHHRYPGAVRQGFFWWEIDVTYYGLWLFQKLGIISGMNPVPEHVRSGAGRR